jgi:hypothetical protein
VASFLLPATGAVLVMTCMGIRQGHGSPEPGRLFLAAGSGHIVMMAAGLTGSAPATFPSFVIPRKE